MPYIKKLVIKGFKSFANETEIPFENSMNVVVGPNGSGKSNIIDSLCFVLGRMSIKSMRAAKASNLIFAGTKKKKPKKEASVKLVFDNSDKTFSIDKKEVSIERVVRKDGKSIYKIDEKVKTRQEVIELLSQAGLDPYGFNIVLQGEIQDIVRMKTEERREVIEEVAGISIYETRKRDSLRELEKTEDRLKEVKATLRERRSYLNNLEKERRQALRYQKYKKRIKRYKSSIIKKKIDNKQKELDKVEKGLKDGREKKEKLKVRENRINKEIQELEKEVRNINSSMEKSSGVEQEELHSKISDLRAEITGLRVRKENNESEIKDIENEISKGMEEIRNLKDEVKKLSKEAPSQARKQEELEEKREKLEEIEKEKKKLYNLKQKLSSVKEKVKDRESSLEKNRNESDFLFKEVENSSENLNYECIKDAKDDLVRLKDEEKKRKERIKGMEKEKKRNEGLEIKYGSEIKRLNDLKNKLKELDVCPLCKNKITDKHREEVRNDCEEKIKILQKKKEKVGEIDLEKEEKKLEGVRNKISKADLDLVNLKNIEERKEQIKRLEKEEKELKEEIRELGSKKKSLIGKVNDIKDVEEKYDKVFLEIQEISSRTEENINTELDSKEKSIERLKIELKQAVREKKELKEELEEFEEDLEEKENKLERLEEKQEELEKEFQELIKNKNKIQEKIHYNNSSLLKIQNKVNLIDSKINDLKIEKARLDAEIENLEADFEIYKKVKIISSSVKVLERKLEKTKLRLEKMGAVNLKSLEVYDSVKKEYDKVAEKTEVLESEKGEILKIIEEIDKKKEKTFKKTLKEINKLFNRNFSNLSNKGEVSLKPENEEDIFEEGLEIVVKVGRGKYFDIHSLSGGERTLVALSLIFAIQEYNPYCFYIFDEVDAALDKRNSERLAGLIKKYMKMGQYIIITHNDALISESTTLYGVSMQDGISKIISLEI